MRTKQAFKNTLSSLLLQLVLAVSGIIVPRYFTALYGSAVNGMANSISQFITYMGLVEAGVSAAGTVALYRPLAEKDTAGMNGILSAARSFYLRSGLIFVALDALLILFYPLIVKNEIADAGFVRMMILVLSINGIVDYFVLGKYRVLLAADQRSYVISIAQICGTVVMTLVSILLIELRASAILVKSVAAAVYVLRSAVVCVYARRRYPSLDFHCKPNLAAFGQRWAALLHQVVTMVVNNTDIVLLTVLLPQGALAEVSVYSVYNLVAYAISSLLSSISSGIRSSFGQVISVGEQDVLRRSFSSFEYAFFLLTFIAYACMAVLLYPFIGLYSADFQDGVVYLRWSLVALFTAAGVLQSVRIPGSTITVAAGHYRQTQGRAVLEALINIVVSVALIRPFGIRGVLLGTCASYLYRSADVILYNAKYFLPGTLKTTLLRLLRNGVVSGGLVFCGLQFVPSYVNGWIAWMLYAFGVGVVVCAVLVGVNFLFEPAEFKRMFDRVKAMALRTSSAKK